MGHKESMAEERAYLETVVRFLQSGLQAEAERLKSRKERLVSARKEMWEEAVYFSKDFDKLADANQHMPEINIRTLGYIHTAKTAEKYRRLLDSPYFGRIDFREEGEASPEKIYIGLSSVTDPKTGDILVYDWRSPVAGIFYQYELGNAAYRSPGGEIRGEVWMKRQYKIRRSVLKYFFDCSLTINDEILQEVLGRHASGKMRNIVTSIQKEQDKVIRDTENELVVVQGVAGSGKTSIALHRIAFLLYHGLERNLKSQNIVIISPNLLFSQYISGVLPELGEDNVTQFTFEEFALSLLKEKGEVENRSFQLEAVITAAEAGEENLKTQSIEWKGSESFTGLLERLVGYWEKRLIPFEDIYYDGEILYTRQQLKAIFLDNKLGLPAAKRLERIENMIYDRMHPLQKRRLAKIEKLVEKHGGHEFGVRQFSRLLSLKEFRTFQKRLQNFIAVDYFEVYKKLFGSRELFHKLVEGPALSGSRERILRATADQLAGRRIAYEDCAPLLYLKLRLEGADLFADIRHVVIDEAQDYYPIQYEIFKRLFSGASFTVLGDIRQSMERDAEEKMYEDVIRLFGKSRSLKLCLSKSYRSSYEITGFCGKLIRKPFYVEALRRSEKEPEVIGCAKLEDMDAAVLRDAAEYLAQGYASVAVLCKTAADAQALYARLKNRSEMKLIHAGREEYVKGIAVLPIYLSKGLEFDAVLVYDAGAERYKGELDRRLLYIACTRALHRLALYYSGRPSPFLNTAAKSAESTEY